MSQASRQSPTVSILRRSAALLASVIITTLLCSALSTYVNFGMIRDLGQPIAFAEYVRETGQTLKSFGPLFAIVCAIGFLIAFSVAGFLRRYIPLPRALAFALAGAAAMAVMLMAIFHYAQGQQVIGAAKTTGGYIVTLGLGALGGFIFALLTRPARGGAHKELS